jgi:iron complex transport system substrate-binding protein
MRRPIYLFLLAAALCCCSSGKRSEVDRRESGTQIPERIITLAPSATELLVALGQTPKIIGRDQFSTTPPELVKLPVLGDFLTPNVEAIAGLKPDLVVLDESQTRAIEALKTLGVRTLPLAMHQLSDVRHGLIEVGEAVGHVERARALVAEIDTAVQTYAAKGQARVEHPVVLAIIDRDPEHLRNLIAAGPNTYLDELLTLAGARNMMSGSAVRYPQISSEQILRSAPDIIIDLSKSQGGLSAYQAVAEAPAVKNRRVHIVNEPLLLSPTPRIREALARVFELTELTPSL